MPYPGDELAVKTLYKNISIQVINKRQRKPKELSKTDNPETLPILGTQDTGRRQTKQKNKTNKNTKTTHETTEDYNSDTGGTGQTRYKHRKSIQEWAIQRHWQHWEHYVTRRRQIKTQQNTKD